VLLLTGNVMAPRFKPFKLMRMYTLLLKNITFNNPFVLNLLNVANFYIFNCERAANVENDGGIPGFLDEFCPFWVDN